METAEFRLEMIQPPKHNPRTEFDQERLRELALSMQEHGVLQPLVIRESGIGGWEIVAGHRRYLAAQLAGLQRVPVVIRRRTTDRQALVLALVENMQRVDLNPIDRARGYQALIEQHGLTQAEVAQRVGVSQSSVAHALRLLNLPEETQEQIETGVLSASHGKALATLADRPSEVRYLAAEVVERNIPARQLEKRVQTAGGTQLRPRQADPLEAAVDDVLAAVREAVALGWKPARVMSRATPAETLREVARFLRATAGVA